MLEMRAGAKEQKLQVRRGRLLRAARSTKMTKAEVASLGIRDREAKQVAGTMWVHDLRAGEIACTLSHVSAWCRAVRSGATTMNVDDFLFCNRAVS